MKLKSGFRFGHPFSQYWRDTMSSDLVKTLPICPNRERSGPPNTSKSSATGGYLMIWRVSPCCAWISAGLAAISAGLARSQPVSLPSPLEGSSACLGRETAPCASRTPPFHAPDRLRIPPAAPVGVTGCDLAKPAEIRAPRGETRQILTISSIWPDPGSQKNSGRAFGASF